MSSEVPVRDVKEWPVPPPDQFANVGRCASSGKDITICYNAFGEKANPCVLLIMGLNCPAPYWDSRFCQMIADSGFFVVRYDNRDVGLSTHFDEYKPPVILRLAVPASVSVGEGKPPYTLQDMAADAIGLLDVLDVKQAHIVGCSMGGMIAQHVLLQYPDRTRSVCLLSTSSGKPLPAPSALIGLIDHPANDSMDAVLDYKERHFGALAGKLKLPGDFRLGMKYTLERSSYEEGNLRQLTAIARDPDRSEALQTVNKSMKPPHPPPGRGLVPLVKEISAAVTAKTRVALQSYGMLTQGPNSTASEEAEKAAAAAAANDPQHGRYIPVVVVHGGSDPMMPPANASKLASLIAGSKLVIFPDMGHYFPPSMFLPIAEEVVLNARKAEHLLAASSAPAATKA